VKQRREAAAHRRRVQQILDGVKDMPLADDF
jgi:hypothetical protein